MAVTRDNAVRILFLDICMKIEELSSELYHYFGNLYADDSAACLWKKTASEEENHRRQYELLLHLREEVEFDITPQDLERAWGAHGKVLGLLDTVRRHPPDLSEALSLSIEMEESLADLHVQSAVRFRDESVARLFQALGRADLEHVEELKRYRMVLMLPVSEMVSGEGEGP